jgi:hypothetical protein
MKKLTLMLIASLLGCFLVQAQIRVRTTKPVTTQEITKTNAISPSGTSSSTGSVTQPIASTQPDSFLPPYYNNTNYARRTIEINPSNRTYAFHAVDYNGDGIKDIAYKDFFLNDLLGWFFSSPDGFSVEYKSAHDWTQYTSIGMLGFMTVEADVNGDRRPDLLGISPSLRQIGLLSSVSPVNNVGVEVHQLANSQRYIDFPASFSDQFIPFSGDFNGDRRGDLALWFHQTGEWQIALSNGTFVDFTPNAWISNWGLGISNAQPLTGDFNGDGFTDIAIRDNQKGTWSVAFNNRNQTFSPVNGCEGEFWIQGWATDFNMIFRSGDFNGDRIDDLVSFQPETATWQYVLNVGNCFQGFSKPVVMGDVNTYPLVTDINGDGKSDLVAGNLAPSGNYAQAILQISINTGK